MKHVFIAQVKDGKLVGEARGKMAAFIKSKDGVKLLIEISAISKRTLKQNAYLHLVLGIFTDGLNQLGNHFAMEQVKELCKCKFLLVDEADESTGEIIGQRIRGTSELTKEEMGEFIDKIRGWALDHFNIYLPEAEEQLEMPL